MCIRDRFKTILKEIKKLCREKKLIVDYKGDEEAGNRIQRWAMGCLLYTSRCV